MKKVIKERPDIAFSIILYPLPMHKESYGRSKAIFCGKSIDLLNDAFERKPLPAARCETTAIDDNIKLGQRLGINGTPTLIFPNGMVISGALDAAEIIRRIDKK
jgi:thiol:disulfide interchange protein DsbC